MKNGCQARNFQERDSTPTAKSCRGVEGCSRSLHFGFLMKVRGAFFSNLGLAVYGVRFKLLVTRAAREVSNAALPNPTQNSVFVLQAPSLGATPPDKISIHRMLTNKKSHIHVVSCFGKSIVVIVVKVF